MWGTSCCRVGRLKLQCHPSILWFQWMSLGGCILFLVRFRIKNSIDPNSVDQKSKWWIQARSPLWQIVKSNRQCKQSRKAWILSRSSNIRGSRTMKVFCLQRIEMLRCDCGLIKDCQDSKDHEINRFQYVEEWTYSIWIFLCSNWNRGILECKESRERNSKAKVNWEGCLNLKEDITGFGVLPVGLAQGSEICPCLWVTRFRYQ